MLETTLLEYLLTLKRHLTLWIKTFYLRNWIILTEEHVHKYEAVLWTMEKLRKKNFVRKWNFQETCILVILKGLHQQKLKRSFGCREMTLLHCYWFIKYLAFKKSILKNYHINSYTSQLFENLFRKFNNNLENQKWGKIETYLEFH